MRKVASLLAALILSSPVLAINSTQTDYDHASADVIASGSIGDGVSFTIDESQVTLPVGQMKPGATYTVNIPVQNTSANSIDATATATTTDGATYVANVDGTGTSSATIGAGATGNLIFRVTLSSNANVPAGATVTIKFTVNGTFTPAS
ncbi:hypothetical protein E5F05_18445 [Deinococcus metallilatus]|uniref:DUF11 domain-containing protein n=1 Tax=Deinococcus metallilatus TaxID=1211322 RepID=A0AAJ5F2U3_9DEIO|nr:hypothetical protein [Deinococcus metallilatus]MBB5296214.1 hypothetical protein [Deinococcus metallilatus]QBY09739.1 hypothetical protein E5F05_18445 [Deinococcus metallilatus]RXJ08937.1 hypothetical protein ERJ73_17280 [Deinococcus metallilatus]TLK23684.1 hypothetical protein FCS05_15800 [Deinococcus metallilatus]GMA14080.1 hypothetical protein GCM10025871_04110 [Deinococcus metallilatus]